MNIIPAIDIKDGKVVKAKQGDRDRYNPISKDSGFSSDPFKFIKEMAKVYRPSIFYIADINSLINENHNIDLIKDIANMNKNIHFWVDIGGKIDQRLAKRNIEPILCSESCLSIKNINYIYRNYIHSYDYNYEATMMAIKGAVSGKPTAEDVVAAAADSAHPYSPK